jgi:hypothetical protein
VGFARAGSNPADHTFLFLGLAMFEYITLKNTLKMVQWKQRFDNKIPTETSSHVSCNIFNKKSPYDKLVQSWQTMNTKGCSVRNQQMKHQNPEHKRLRHKNSTDETPKSNYCNNDTNSIALLQHTKIYTATSRGTYHKPATSRRT